MEHLKEAFENLEGLDHEKLKLLSQKIRSYLEQLDAMLTRGERSAALDAALEIKLFLESKTYMMMEALRINEEEYQEILKNPFFSDQEQNTITQISENLRYEKYNKK